MTARSDSMHRITLFVLLSSACAAPIDDRFGEEEGDDGGVGSTSAALSVPAFCASYPRPMPPNGWEADAVHYLPSGRLHRVYVDGELVPDFSYAGYKNGSAALPLVGMRERVSPGPGDDTARIQAALDRVGARSLPSPTGFRGAVLLDPGQYQIGGTLRLNRDGVVLRGYGRCGQDSDTTLRITGTDPNRPPAIIMGTGTATRFANEDPTRRTGVTERVLLPETSIDVQDPDLFEVGDTVVVAQPMTQAIINAMDGDRWSPPWTPSQVDAFRFKRRVVSKNLATGSITIDAPLYQEIEPSLGPAYIAKLRPGGAVARIGVEDLRVSIDYNGSLSDKNHASKAIVVLGAEDAWIRNVMIKHYWEAGIEVQEAARVTVQNVEVLDPIGPRDAGAMYSFKVAGYAQHVLFVNCKATNGRHHYVSNGETGVSGVVFLRSESNVYVDDAEISEGHRHWSQGLLYDNIVEHGHGNAHLGCRGNTGDSNHGWSATNSVFWNYAVDDGRAYLEKPPWGQNWAFGRTGVYTRETEYCGSSTPLGHVETANGVLRQQSLYEAELCERFRRDGGNASPPDFTPAPRCGLIDNCGPGQLCCRPAPGGGCDLCRIRCTQ